MADFNWMMPYFEPRGLGLTLALCALFLAVVLFISGRAMQWRLAGLRWATLGVGMAAVGFLLNMLMGYINPVITIVGGLSMMLGGELLVLMGMRQLRGLPAHVRPLFVAWLLAVGFAYWFGVVDPQGRVRIGTMALLLSCIAWWLLVVTCGEKRPVYRAGMRLLQLFSATFAVLMTLRFISIGILGISIPDNITTNFVNSISVLSGGIALIGAVVGLIYLSVGDLVLTLRRLAERDPMTDLRNRRSLREHLSAAPPHKQLVVAMIDLDHFKRLNDSQGHAAGDAVIRQMGHLLGTVETHEVTHEIIPYRMGGEEFSLLFLFHTPMDATWALSWAQQLTNDLRLQFVHIHPSGLSAGLSVGTVAHLETALRQADQALYEAKHRGRNQVLTHDVAWGKATAFSPVAQADEAQTTPTPPVAH